MAGDKAGKHGGKFKGKRSARAGLLFSVSKALRDLKKLNTSHVRVETEAAVCTAAVLEFLAAELLELAGNASLDLEVKRITRHNLKCAMKEDKEIDCLINFTPWLR
ncbi:unnamed protein product [Ceutorhynchus assimilis]|uniref:Histone H2A n=1 Tax=Ceutorhynchus assimilis TaxID=467358 RepID=A0A9N9QIL1_9CUCU|nr:unnamed protein product [Ceutorhynchus assimilis]